MKKRSSMSVNLKSIYVVTMWSGGKPARKWKSEQEPTPLPQGTGVTFTSIETKLAVQVIGSISIEQYESGKEDFESRMGRDSDDPALPEPEPPTPRGNIKRLF